MTGLGANCSGYLFVSSRAQNTTYRYVAPGIYSRYAWVYYSGGSQTRDIAMTPEGNVWVATDWSSMPMRLYDQNDQMIDFLDSSVLPGARGVTIDDEGFLWVSDIENDKIYRVDLTEGIEGPGPVPSPCMNASANPFSGHVTITGEGWGDGASIGIYDLSGTLVGGGEFDGSFVFGDPEGSRTGVYFARVTGGGSVSVLKLTGL
ncbi:MAG: hypothetical protein AVO35_01320 [Candidatus Aegiribacteria sp. MLS_C]|nr:MAG: hypothetical protein AVO35_01320 [Candidatus Aegiribacteria sp. MLS_C]